jgi:hypothetical protein
VRSERKVLRSLGESIAALGDAAGCVILVGPESLAVLVNPKILCLLYANDVVAHGPAALSTFVTRLQSHGLDHPNVDLAMGLYGQLVRRCEANGNQFRGVGKTQDEIADFFTAPRVLEPLKPPAP